MSLSVTETPNELTHDLDVIGTKGIVSLFNQSDAQLFCGWKHYPSIYDNEIISALSSLVTVGTTMFSSTPLPPSATTESNVSVMISGAGTSGRLAFFCARTFNRVLLESGKSACFHYLIAGGDKALIVGQEGSEDDVSAAVKDLETLIQKTNSKNNIYVGITCGFSAPYVAAQLDYLMKHNSKGNFVCVLMGFNPVDLARKIPVEKWDKSFSDVVGEMCQLKKADEEKANAPRYFFINPVVGPEPLTGSTRMKGGSATKILLEIVFATIISNVFGIPLIPDNISSPKSDGSTSPPNQKSTLYYLLTCYEQIYRATYYYAQDVLPHFIECAGNSLRALSAPTGTTEKASLNHGHVYYLAHSSIGILAFIDASETVPTFGASFEEVRAFILNKNEQIAWKVVGNHEGDLSSVGPQYDISQQYFEEVIVPKLTARDTVILLHHSNEPNENMITLARLAKNRKSIPYIALISVSDASSPSNDVVRPILETIADSTLYVNLPFSNILPNIPAFAEIAVKWILNAISTGGFILQGKVFKNRMIDLGITNSKLFYRACGIVAQFGNVNKETARVNLLRAIYNLEQNVLSAEIDKAPIYQHIEKAYTRKFTKLIPLAILLCTGKFTIQEAQFALDREPIVRNILAVHNK